MEPFRPLEIALALGCGFVARGFSGDAERLADLIMQGVGHRGFSLIDVLQPCVSFNKVNTHAWYKERVYAVEEEAGYAPADLAAAFVKARQWGERIALGVLYRSDRPSYEELSGLSGLGPLVDYEADHAEFEKCLQKIRLKNG
jgi:2-oxoglutarate ferredoxin oxidoreductase subunit beta